MDRHGTKLWASWPSQSSAEEAATYLLGPVLGLLLRFRGVTCLHASAVAIGGSVIAFVGAEGAGKSTTAAAFARAGFAAVSDDVVALVEREGDFFVSPSYPHLCLWPESVEMLYGTADALPPFVPNWEKRRLSFANGGARFEDGALPLRAIYLLDEIRDEPGPHVEAVSAQTGFLALVANSFATNMLDSEMRANEFKTLSSLVAKVPLRRLFTSKGQLAPADLCQAVLHDLASLNPLILIPALIPPLQLELAGVPRVYSPSPRLEQRTHHARTIRSYCGNFAGEVLLCTDLKRANICARRRARGRPLQKSQRLRGGVQ